MDRRSRIDAREAVEVFAQSLADALATRAAAVRWKLTSTTAEHEAHLAAAEVLDDAALAVAHALRGFKDALEQSNPDESHAKDGAP